MPEATASTFGQRWRALLRATGALSAGLAPRRLQPILNNGRNDGPPDLDELWRDFNRKLGGLFGGGRGGRGDRPSGGGGSPMQPPDMKSAGIGVGLIAGVLVLIWGASGFFIVQEGQQAVVTAFGKLQPHRRRRLPVAAALPVPGARHGVGDAVAFGRRRPQHGGAVDRPARLVDADAGREHHRHPLHGAVPAERRARLPVREPRPG
jgi:hypothetical protein